MGAFVTEHNYITASRGILKMLPEMVYKFWKNTRMHDLRNNINTASCKTALIQLTIVRYTFSRFIVACEMYLLYPVPCCYFRYKKVCLIY
jgi:hypothetical protein